MPRGSGNGTKGTGRKLPDANGYSRLDQLRAGGPWIGAARGDRCLPKASA
jgi:hypothetical protein